MDGWGGVSRRFAKERKRPTIARGEAFGGAKGAELAGRICAAARAACAQEAKLLGQRVLGGADFGAEPEPREPRRGGALESEPK